MIKVGMSRKRFAQIAEEIKGIIKNWQKYFSLP